MINPSDFEFYEEKRLFQEADQSQMPGYKRRGIVHPIRHGLPRFKEIPRVKVAVKNKPADFYGFRRWVLSTRAKELLESMDPEAFDFVRCETTTSTRNTVDDYWLGSVRRIITDFDKAASKFEFYGREQDVVTDEWIFNYAIRDLYELTLHPGDEGKLAFYLRDYDTYPIFDGQLVDAIRKKKLRGLAFSPLQWPDKGDVRTVYISNHSYWKERGAL